MQDLTMLIDIESIAKVQRKTKMILKLFLPFKPVLGKLDGNLFYPHYWQLRLVPFYQKQLTQ
jgi:hypothetical protein